MEAFLSLKLFIFVWTNQLLKLSLTKLEIINSLLVADLVYIELLMVGYIDLIRHKYRSQDYCQNN